MALEIESVSPHHNDADEKSMIYADLEDGEIEDDELQAENKAVSHKNEIVKSFEAEVSSQKSKTNKSKVNRKKENANEDDREGNVEKAIRVNSASEIQEEDERKARKKKRKRKHRDDDEDRKDSKKRKRSYLMSKEFLEDDPMGSGTLYSDDEDEDNDEMLFIRGASPLMDHSFDDETFEFDEEYDEEFDDLLDESDLEHEEFLWSCGDNRGFRRGRGGRGRMMRRGGRRGLPNKRMYGAMGRRGNKRMQQMMQDQRSCSDLCIFFMQGKCQKGDDCPYSHDAHPPRKMELCKFYLMDCCAKKDKCLYMHSDFPCKFYHTGMECFSGDRCKFSHGALSTTQKTVLLKHLETAPKEILGDFPRLTKEGAALMVSKKNRNKKIPSIFEIEVPVPAQLRSGDEDRSPGRRSTPMPESDNEDEELIHTPSPPTIRGEMRKHHRWDLDDSERHQDIVDEDRPHKGKLKTIRGNADSKKEDSEERQVYWRSPDSYHDGDFSELQDLRMQFSEGANDEEVAESKHQRRHKHRHSRSKSTEDSEREKRSKRKNKRREGRSSKSHESEDLKDNRIVNAVEPPDNDRKQKNDHCQEANEVGRSTNYSPPNISTGGQEHGRRDLGDSDHNISTETAGIPFNLPKKQRELFLRIQHQQREAGDLSRQDGSSDKYGRDHNSQLQQEENWYSSDEEETSLTDLLRKLSKQQPLPEEKGNTPSPPPPPPPPPPPSLGNIKLRDIDISESVSRLLSTIRNQQANATSTENTESQTQSKTEASTVPTPQARDPRLLSRDPRNRSQTVPDPRTSRRSSSSEERHEVHRPNIYGCAIPPSRVTLRGQSDGVTDAELKNLLARINSRQDSGSDVDLRRQNVNLGSPDTDLRGGDLDLRLPFKPVPLHTPATEIEASLTSHPQMSYKVIRISIPRPDYSGLKIDVSENQMRHDPRLRRLFKLKSNTNPNDTSRQAAQPKQIDPRRRSAQPTPIIYSDIASPNSTNMMHNQGMVPGMSQMPISVSSSVVQTIGSSMCISVGSITHSTSSSMGHMGSSMGPSLAMSMNPACPPMNPMHPSLGSSVGPSMVPPMIPPMGSNMSFDPRMSRNLRNAPSLLGPGPLPMNFCPSTPRYEDVDEGNSNGSDGDFRMYCNSGSMNRHRSQRYPHYPQDPHH